jgi:hypothetical protein
MDQFSLHETVTIQLRKIGLPYGSAHRRSARRPTKHGLRSPLFQCSG